MTYELEPKTITLDQGDCDEMLGLLDKALEAADGDSNDEEIEALQAVRDQAVLMLGVNEVDDDDPLSLLDVPE